MTFTEENLKYRITSISIEKPQTTHVVLAHVRAHTGEIAGQHNCLI
jgi:hypothetical protein